MTKRRVANYIFQCKCDTPFVVCTFRLFSVSDFFAFAVAAYVFFFAAADGFEFFIFVCKAVVAVAAVAVAFKGYLEVLLEYSIAYSNESTDADKRADDNENKL